MHAHEGRGVDSFINKVKSTIPKSKKQWRVELCICFFFLLLLYIQFLFLTKAPSFDTGG